MKRSLLTDILDEAARTRPQGPSAALLRHAWASLVGPEIAGATEPAFYREGTLHIRVASSAWMRALTGQRRTLLGRLNHRLPWPVQRLSFEVSDVRPSPATPRPAPPRGAPVSSEPVDDATEAVIGDLDPTLRDQLRRIRRHLLRERADHD